MHTYFASPERGTDHELSMEINAVGKNQFISGLLRSINGLLAIVDEHRQIVALNDSLLQLLGLDDPNQALGLRPGEALKCVHASREPGGCGTSEYCSTCGAAIAIVTTLGQDKPTERICALSAKRNGSEVDIALLVKAQPVKIEDKKFVLLFLQDITAQEQQAALERTFYHDINNMLGVLVQASELLTLNDPSPLGKTIHGAATRLVREVEIQRSLSENAVSHY